jgi:hypothetical protein
VDAGRFDPQSEMGEPATFGMRFGVGVLEA